MTPTRTPSAWIVPPWPELPLASTVPEMRLVPPSACRRMLPPLALFAVVLLPASSVRSLVATSRISPLAPTTALFASTTPPWRTSAPNMPMRPESEISCPTLSACSASATRRTVTKGEPSETSSTLLPAASTISPCGERMTPEFCTSGPTRNTRPPGPPELVSMTPALETAPAPGVSVKRSRPLRKSWSDRFRLEATNPATSMRALDPITMPLELSRNTRPLEESTPSITLCGMTPFAPTTRLSTAEDPEDCRNRVISLTPIEKLCQLMMALALLVIVSVLPELAKLALPEHQQRQRHHQLAEIGRAHV